MIWWHHFEGQAPPAGLAQSPAPRLARHGLRRPHPTHWCGPAPGPPTRQAWPWEPGPQLNTKAGSSTVSSAAEEARPSTGSTGEGIRPFLIESGTASSPLSGSRVSTQVPLMQPSKASLLNV